MTFIVRPRLGIGIDFEHNEDIIYRVQIYDEDKDESYEDLFCYNGLIVKLPFLTIQFGDFAPLSEVLEDERD